jgi:hypothetical protein
MRVLHFLAAKRRKHVAAGVSPQTKSLSESPKPRSGDSDNTTRRLLPPLRGFMRLLVFFPWAYTHGYMLPPLRG